MSKSEHHIQAGMTDLDIEELRIGRLRMNISANLQELAAEEAPDFQWLALKRLVGAAIEACGCVMEAGRKNPSLARALAGELTHWPILYSVFPGEPDALRKHIQQIGVGHSAPIGLKKWRLKAPGTRWAHAYWQLVNESKAYHRIDGTFPEPVDGWVLLLRGQVLLQDAQEAIALPPLSKKEAALDEWGAAYRCHLERHFPGAAVLDHSDWKQYFGKTKLDSIGKRKAKMLEMVAKGFRAIAPQE